MPRVTGEPETAQAPGQQFPTARLRFSRVSSGKESACNACTGDLKTAVSRAKSAFRTLHAPCFSCQFRFQKGLNERYSRCFCIDSVSLFRGRPDFGHP